MPFIEVTDRRDNVLVLVNLSQVRTVLDSKKGAIIVMTTAGHLAYNIEPVESYESIRDFIAAAERTLT